MRRLRGLLIAWVSFTLFGCAATPPPAPPKTAFAQCMELLGYKFHYTSDMVKAADWCRQNENGGIK